MIYTFLRNRSSIPTLEYYFTMCGRYSLTSGSEMLKTHFALQSVPVMEARYNISPSQTCAVIIQAKNGSRQLTSMRWGLIPHWSNGPSNQFSLFNARSETAAVKPSFREPFETRHCLIPADGYYEWATEKTGKKAYRIATEDQLTFAFAGIWDVWRSSDAEIFSFAILTTQSTPKFRSIHHRMPIIIQRKNYSDWIINSHTHKCLSGNVSSALIASQLSNRINNPRNDGPDVWLP